MILEIPGVPSGFFQARACSLGACDEEIAEAFKLKSGVPVLRLDGYWTGACGDIVRKVVHAAFELAHAEPHGEC